MTLQGVSQWLVRPHPSIDDPVEGRRASLLASTTLVIVPVGSLLLGLILLMRPQFAAYLSVQSTIAALIIGVLVYFINRAGRLQLAAWLLVLSTLGIFTLVPFAPGAVPAMLSIGALSVIFAGFFFDRNRVVIIAAVQLIAMTIGVFFFTVPEEFTGYLYVLASNIALEVTFIVYLNYQSSVERERHASLERANARLQAVFDNSPAVILLADTQGRIERLNMSKEISDLLRGQSVMNYLVSDADKERTQEAIRRAVELQEPTAYEALLRDPRGRLTWASLLVGPVRLGSGPIEQVMCVMQDIGERKEAEERLRRLAQDLEDRVRERTTDLEQARDRAEQADRVKSQFLAAMSHELRTPLNAVINFTAITRKGLLGPINAEQEDVLSRAVASGQHLLALINDLLDISQMSTGNLRLRRDEAVDLRPEFEQALSEARSLIGERSLRVEMEMDPALPLIHADPRRVRQVLLNLLSNAVKFTPEGLIRVTVTQQEGDLCCAVRDQGPGIELARQQQIFDPFVQTENGLRHQGGTGLGLAIARYIVEGHGGRIWVESEPGQGANFFFTIPLAEQAPAS